MNIIQNLTEKHSELQQCVDKLTQYVAYLSIVEPERDDVTSQAGKSLFHEIGSHNTSNCTTVFGKINNVDKLETVLKGRACFICLKGKEITCQNSAV